jgi:hypothetical protein
MRCLSIFCLHIKLYQFKKNCQVFFRKKIKPFQLATYLPPAARGALFEKP